MVRGARLVGRYELREVLGAGGMGVVHRAFDMRLGREVAIKVVDLSAAPEAARIRFEREALAVGRLRSPHVVSVHDVGEDITGGGRIGFLVMELLEGVPLQAVLAHSLPTAADVVAWGRQMCGGLRDAHAAGVVHRDVKPSNVMLSPHGTVTLIDFGIAQMNAGSETVTLPGTVMGTPAYMAPERLRGEAGDVRCDLYSLGCVLYELLTGRPPFGPGLPRPNGAQPLPVRAVRPDVPVALEALVLDLLCAHPGGRPDAVQAERRLTAVATPTPPAPADATGTPLWAAPTQTATRRTNTAGPGTYSTPPSRLARSPAVGQRPARKSPAPTRLSAARGSAGRAALAGAASLWAQLSLFTEMPGWATAGLAAAAGLGLWVLCAPTAEPESGSSGNVMAALGATVALTGYLAGWTTVPWWGVLATAVLHTPVLLGVCTLVATVAARLTGGRRPGMEAGVTAGLVNASALMVLLGQQVPTAATVVASSVLWLALACSCASPR
ncbi:protein kinase domain-containing protein [Streptomyces scabiei]|uniref:serine/threonine-protein kinase n=1 Tax=Streptomyces scabiei TaxID=1930 RepID=UPI0038F677CE